MAAYSLALEHTINVVPEMCITLVATREMVQVFVIQEHTLNKYKEKWLATVDKYYNEILPAQQEEMEMEGLDEDKKTS